MLSRRPRINCWRHLLQSIDMLLVNNNVISFSFWPNSSHYSEANESSGRNGSWSCLFYSLQCDWEVRLMWNVRQYRRCYCNCTVIYLTITIQNAFHFVTQFRPFRPSQLRLEIKPRSLHITMQLLQLRRALELPAAGLL